MPVDADGNVVLDHLPAPVIGTFWPYSADRNVRLLSVTAGWRRVRVEQTALSVEELLAANAGAEVIVTERPPAGERTATYHATIVGIPQRSIDELERVRPPHTEVAAAEAGRVIVLKTSEGSRAVSLDRIQDVVFKGEYKKTVSHEENRAVLTLHLDWAGRKPEKTARVGMAYLQKGLRWIPNYRIEIDGGGKALVKLQATMINELADLDGVTAHLVVGVPSFTFKETTDPIALSHAAARLSQYFDTNAQTAYAMSNAMMTQMSRATEHRVARAAPPAAADLGPDIGGAGKSEDMFLFTVKNVRLKKGARAVQPVGEYAVTYKDVYSLELAHYPPPEIARSRHVDPRNAEFAKLFHAPKAVHKLRLTNASAAPFTTAPALIVRDNRVLAQAMMTYTSPGSTVDIELTTAVDIRVKKTEKEVKRTANVYVYNGRYVQFDLTGSIVLANHSGKAAEVEVVRHVFGHADSADNGGQTEMVNLLEDQSAGGPGGYPYWWGWYSWPDWWRHVNGVGRITWNVTVEAGKTVELKYGWHYYWP
jgi:hypothetical protein